MPVERCQIDNQDGYRWGPNGKCYTGPDAESKAAEQGRAIQAAGGLKQLQAIREALAKVKVSFDYDGTLTQPNVQRIVKELIKGGGTEVYIISARADQASMYPLSQQLGIPMSRIFATGSNKAKVKKIKDLGISKHYDNNPDVIKQLPGIGKQV